MQSIEQQPLIFQTKFCGIMEMYSDIETVAHYLNHHRGWFVRCANPMKAEPFGEHGYTLVIGRYGAFGYDVEPQMSVILEPPNFGKYIMYSVPNPNFHQDGYEVDYHSEMEIEPININQVDKDIEKVFAKEGIRDIPGQITKISWQLDLQVAVKFPSFVYKFSTNVIQNTGDRLLAQIIKQVSPRLTLKVQKDFHSTFNLPIPPKSSRSCERIL